MEKGTKAVETSYSHATRPTASRTLRGMDEHVEEFAALFGTSAVLLEVAVTEVMEAEPPTLNVN